MFRTTAGYRQPLLTADSPSCSKNGASQPLQVTPTTRNSTEAVTGRWLRLTLLLISCASFQWTVMRDGINTINEIENSYQSVKSPIHSQPVPLFFGMGQGTTGTHSMYDATCRLNVTSVHGNAVCIDVNDHSELKPNQIDGIKAHFYALSHYKHLRECAEEGKRCTFAEVIENVNKMKEMIREVILSGVNAVHDTPYPFMTKFVIETALAVRKHPPILITSERDPVKWSARRAETHSIAIICRRYFTFDSEPSSMGMYDAFDMDNCVELASRQSPQPLMYSQVFASYRQLISEADGNQTKLDQITEFNRIAIYNYQTIVRTVYPLVYAIDMFERDQPATELTIAQEIEREIISSSKISNATRAALQAARVHVIEKKIRNRSSRGMPHRFIKPIVRTMHGSRPFSKI